MIYKDIQEIYKKRNKKGISTCAIADAKRKLGILLEKAETKAIRGRKRNRDELSRFENVGC